MVMQWFADHAILVRKSAVGHGAIIDEALHVDTEQLEM